MTMFLRRGSFIALTLGLSLGGTYDALSAPARETDAAIVKRIGENVSRGFWQSERLFVIGAGVSLERDGLKILSTRCSNMAESVQQNRMQCTFQAFASSKAIAIRLGEVDPASVKAKVLGPDEAGGTVSFQC
jgi:hypothetical protein